MNWTDISTEQLSIDFLKEHKEQVNWYWISENITLNEEILETFREQIVWETIAKNPTLSFELLCFVEKHKEVNWYWISKEYPLTYDMYLRLEKRLDAFVLHSNTKKDFHVLFEETVSDLGTQWEFTVVKEKE